MLESSSAISQYFTVFASIEHLRPPWWQVAVCMSSAKCGKVLKSFLTYLLIKLCVMISSATHFHSLSSFTISNFTAFVKCHFWSITSKLGRKQFSWKALISLLYSAQFKTAENVCICLDMCFLPPTECTVLTVFSLSFVSGFYQLQKEISVSSAAKCSIVLFSFVSLPNR